MAATLWLAGESALLPSRIQMAFTLATHVLLVPLGVALPSLTLLMEGIGLARKDPVALKIARRWSVVMAVQFAVGAVTGTILSFEFGLLWPRLMARFGAAMGIGFAIEGLAFFLEAIFIGIYLYGWERLQPRTHFLLGLALPPAGLLGTVSVLAANSFMNTPGGVKLISGQVIDGSGAIHFGLAIPSLDSLLVGYSAGTVVPGLSSVAADARPSIVEANITHLAFDAMVGLGTAGVLLAAWYFWVLVRRRRLPDSAWFYRLAALAGVGCYAAVEAGWVTTEVGRQPWIVYGLMRVSDAVTGAPASFVWTMLATLVVVYALIAYFFIYLLVRLAARWRREDSLGPSAPEEGAPYGPRPAKLGRVGS